MYDPCLPNIPASFGYLREIQKQKQKSRLAGFASFIDGSNLYEQQAKKVMQEVAENHANDEEEMVIRRDQIRISPQKMARNIVEYAPVTWFSTLSMVVLLVNIVMLATWRYEQSMTWIDVQWSIDFACNLFYVIEILLRIAALGPVVFVLDIFNVIDACLWGLA